MPTYQYQCNACSHTFDHYQSIKALALTACPKCEEETLQKVISGGSGYFLRDSGIFPDDKPSSKKENKKVKKEPHQHGHHCHHH